jgi:hypothetical protein
VHVAVTVRHCGFRLALNLLGSVRKSLSGRREATFDPDPEAGNLRISNVGNPPDEILHVRQQGADLLPAIFTDPLRCIGRVIAERPRIAANAPVIGFVGHFHGGLLHWTW